MEFFVLGRDADGVDQLLEELTEAHWSYMDRFAGQLRARGPLLSADRTRHAGSMHVVEVPDVAAAYRFAYEEPFECAGVFADLSVTRYVSCGHRTMFDGSPAAQPAASALVVSRWDAEPMTAGLLEELSAAATEAAGEAWVFLGLLLSDDGASCLGAAGALDLAEQEAAPAFEAMLAATGHASTAVVAAAWQRGGRRA
ncbi:MAG: YciI family protein [Actinomycetales bacterium]